MTRRPIGKLSRRRKHFRSKHWPEREISVHRDAAANAASAELIAKADVNGATFENRRIEIHYDHIPPLLLQPTARLKAVALTVAIRGHTVGYLPGAGDSVADCLTQMGYTVKPLAAADLTEEGLRGLDAVVIGVRAFNVRNDLASHLASVVRLCRSRRQRDRAIQSARWAEGENDAIQFANLE